MAEQTGLDKIEQQRSQKLERISEMGVDPYGGRYDGVESADSIVTRFVDDQEGQTACAAGRIVLLRDIGKLIFITLRDSSGTIQLGLSKKILTEQWDLVKLFELGDIIGAKGDLGRTHLKRHIITCFTHSCS